MFEEPFLVVNRSQEIYLILFISEMRVKLIIQELALNFIN